MSDTPSQPQIYVNTSLANGARVSADIPLASPEGQQMLQALYARVSAPAPKPTIWNHQATPMVIYAIGMVAAVAGLAWLQHKEQQAARRLKAETAIPPKPVQAENVAPLRPAAGI